MRDLAAGEMTGPLREWGQLQLKRQARQSTHTSISASKPLPIFNRLARSAIPDIHWSVSPTVTRVERALQCIYVRCDPRIHYVVSSHATLTSRTESSTNNAVERELRVGIRHDDGVILGS